MIFNFTYQIEEKPEGLYKTNVIVFYGFMFGDDERKELNINSELELHNLLTTTVEMELKDTFSPIIRTDCPKGQNYKIIHPGINTKIQFTFTPCSMPSTWTFKNVMEIDTFIKALHKINEQTDLVKLWENKLKPIRYTCETIEQITLGENIKSRRKNHIRNIRTECN